MTDFGVLCRRKVPTAQSELRKICAAWVDQFLGGANFDSLWLGLQADTGLLAIRELDAGGFEGGL
jgi:hypothetical protein